MFRLTPNQENRAIDCTIGEKAGKAMLDELLACHGDIIRSINSPKGMLASFALEANGSAAEVLGGIYPHVQIHPLYNSVLQYDGNMYLRQINRIIDVESTTEFITKHIGRSYEGFTSLLELPLAIVGANKKEKTDKVFCSELVAILYREIGFIPKHVNVSNVIPEQFGSGAGDFDLLRDFAGSDLRIKHIFGLTDLEAEGVTCCGSFLKFFTSCFWCCPQ